MFIIRWRKFSLESYSLYRDITLLTVMQCIKTILHHCTIAHLFPVTGDKILELLMSCPIPPTIKDWGMFCSVRVFMYFVRLSVCGKKLIAHICTLYNNMAPNNGICTLSSLLQLHIYNICTHETFGAFLTGKHYMYKNEPQSWFGLEISSA